MAPWKLPLLVAAIAIPVIAAFYLGGPGLGLAVGALVAAAIVVLAVRQRPRLPLGEAPADATRRRLLVILTCPVEDADAFAEIAAQATGSGAPGARAEVMLLAPARIGFLDRWASDVAAARRAAQENLVHAVAALATAGVSAEARVGDEDVMQAVEDQVGEFPATEVILVAAAAEDERTAAVAAELEERLRARFRRMRVSGPGER